jgi:hypothetical protein
MRHREDVGAVVEELLSRDNNTASVYARNAVDDAFPARPATHNFRHTLTQEMHHHNITGHAPCAIHTAFTMQQQRTLEPPR